MAKQAKSETVPSRRKLKRAAGDLLHMAGKVYHFRKDRLPDNRIKQLENAADGLRRALEDKAQPGEIQARINDLEAVLKATGGRIYPRNFWNDNVEMVLVAAIIVIGFRSFIAQPFIIPTNSMYPSYNGLTSKTYALEESEKPPALPGRLFRFVTLGARHRSMTAPAGGEVLIPVFGDDEPRPGNGYIRYQHVRGLSFGVWPGTVREYTFLVGPNRKPATVRVPRDFAIDDIVLRAFYGPDTPRSRPVVFRQNGLTLIRTGSLVEEGDPILAFDILLGDMLFVDRMSYHFAKPDIGHPFVFKTGGIPGLRGADGRPEDKYYIKRLVGKPGDSLEVDPPVLIRNGAPIKGAPAFAKNAQQTGEYEGYQFGNPTAYAERVSIPIPDGAMLPGQSVQIPEDHYYAMGDNSDQSLDSRMWGFVPEHAIIGRAIFIYYPFSRRWGPAR